MPPPRSDVRLYVGYALAALDPDGIGRDILFLNDGQSKFSVYPLLMRGLAVSLPSFYGGNGVFRYAEHFATPRAYAEACVLAAFAAMLSRRTVWAMSALGLGLAFHPLVTASGKRGHSRDSTRTGWPQ